MRQLALTRMLHWPARSPRSGCSPVPRQVEVAGPLGDVEVGQDAADARHEVRRQPPRAVPFEECPQALVRESHRGDCIA